MERQRLDIVTEASSSTAMEGIPVDAPAPLLGEPRRRRRLLQALLAGVGVLAVGKVTAPSADAAAGLTVIVTCASGCTGKGRFKVPTVDDAVTFCAQIGSISAASLTCTIKQ